MNVFHYLELEERKTDVKAGTVDELGDGLLVLLFVEVVDVNNLIMQVLLGGEELAGVHIVKLFNVLADTKIISALLEV